MSPSWVSPPWPFDAVDSHAKRSFKSLLVEISSFAVVVLVVAELPPILLLLLLLILRVAPVLTANTEPIARLEVTTSNNTVGAKIATIANFLLSIDNCGNDRIFYMKSV